MKFTLSWLKDHLDCERPLDDIATTLTRIGLEVEGIGDAAKALSGFTIAHVISAEQHPNADRLRVCMVDTGSGLPVQVVCGAPNARAGMKSVFSPPGTYIPGKKITLGAGVIRGVESNGMLCSAAELEISDDHDGILDLPADAPLGVTYAAWAGLDDPVIDVALTPNRPDCTAITGIARDLAAAGVGALKSLDIKPVAGSFPCAIDVRLDLPGNPSWCPAFAYRVVRGVKNGPSPDWLQKRLKAVGLRPINALVDITNYISLDRGRPLHVFDVAKLTGALVVRAGREGDSLQALDGRTYTLDATMCVIADDNGPVSIAGIMGGERTGCDETTTDVLIESALWDPFNIAATGRKLAINSDARYRFERGVDPLMTLPGLELATKFAVDFCGGDASDIKLAGTIPDIDRVIDFPVSEVKRLIGADIPHYESKIVLQSLGFWISGHQGEAWKVAPPSWRPDIHGKADLVEEVVRIVGLDRVPATPLPREGHVMGPVLTLQQKRARTTKRLLAARGMAEAITWSFIAKEQAALFGAAAGLDLANPISSDLSTMRPSLLAGLALAAKRNGDKSVHDVALFEVGQIFHGGEPGEQSMSACGIRRGLAKVNGAGRHWQGSASADVFDVKADALSLLSALGINTDALQLTRDAPAWFHPGRSASLRLGPLVLGSFGELHPRTLNALDVGGTLLGFEINLDRLPKPKVKTTRTKGHLALSVRQPVRRDFAFAVPSGVAVGDLIKAARGAQKDLISRVSVFDVYEGKGVGEGQKSVAIEVTLQPQDKTLTDAEIDTVAANIVAEVTRVTGGSLRS